MHSSSHGIPLGLHIPNHNSECFPSLFLLKEQGFGEETRATLPALHSPAVLG